MTNAPWTLTRQAARTLRDIHDESSAKWGQAVADKYLAGLYEVMKKIAVQPERGHHRKQRSAPFLMVPAGQHFIVYDRLGEGVVVLAILHQRRNIERLVIEMAPSLLSQIFTLRQKIEKT